MTARDTLKPIGIGLAVAVAVAVPWSAIVVLDLRLSPRAPWAVPVGVVYACLAFAYLAGRGWPASTSAARQRDFRARPLKAVVL